MGVPARWFADRKEYRRRIANLSRDNWIALNSVALSAEKLHALGCITSLWSSCEYFLFAVFSMVNGGSEQKNWILVHDLGDVAIALRTTELAKRRYKDAECLAAIAHVLECYDACRQNRNTLTHFQLAMAGRTDELAMRRPSRAASRYEADPFPDSLWDIRRVVGDLRRLRGQLDALFIALLTREPPAGRKEQPRPWPPIRRVPRLLWMPPQQAPKRPQPQPRSSPASRRKAALAKRGA